MKKTSIQRNTASLYVYNRQSNGCTGDLEPPCAYTVLCSKNESFLSEAHGFQMSCKYMQNKIPYPRGSAEIAFKIRKDKLFESEGCIEAVETANISLVRYQKIASERNGITASKPLSSTVAFMHTG